MSTKFGLLIDFDLLKAVTLTNTKQEVVFSGHIWTKFGSLMHNNMQITRKWSRSKPEVEFEYGGRLYFETGSSYISATNGAIFTKFGMLRDFDLLKAVTSTNTKPEVVFSGGSRHFDKWI